jgi:hypothetical protein
MSSRGVMHSVSNAAEKVSPFDAGATNSVFHNIALPVGAFATLLAVVAVPILCRADIPSAAASGVLKCYDSAGNYEPCLTRTSARRIGVDGRAAEAQQPASWITTALAQPENWTASAPTAWPKSAPRKRPVLAICGRRSITCLFSAFRKTVTRMVSFAASHAARPNRTFNQHDF